MQCREDDNLDDFSCIEGVRRWLPKVMDPKYVDNITWVLAYPFLQGWERSDGMLKVSGQWVSPFEVEGVLIAHPAVLEVAVVGATDQHGLVNPWAFVVLQNGYEASDSLADELKAFVKARLVPHKYPRWITFVTELAKTATGKIRRFMLRDV